LTRGLAFLSGARPPGDAYGWRLARLRWTRAAKADRVEDWSPEDPAAGTLARAESWVFVPDSSALPLGMPGAGPCHTLRELEAGTSGTAAVDGSPAAAVEFRPSELPASGKETIKEYVSRLLATTPPVFRVVPSFLVGDSSREARPEIVNRLPTGRARILDLGCGAGGLGLARTGRNAWTLTGIEKDPSQAARARDSAAYERVLEGDLAGILPRLTAEGARFDAFVFADVLEHLEDPVAALTGARALAAANATLLAVVPNVGHLSVARDLLLGRHDPVPAGLCDAGHLRWFTRSSLAEALEESGWTVSSIESAPGAPAPDAEPFMALASAWPDADRESLRTYQWIATARAE